MRLSRHRKKLLSKRAAQWEAAQPQISRGACGPCPTGRHPPDEEAVQILEWAKGRTIQPDLARLWCPWRQEMCVAMNRLLGLTAEQQERR